MTCKNCGEQLSGAYCSHCGQSAKVDKITLSLLMAGISEGIFQVNRGYLYTIKALSLHPGQSIREYLIGRRQKFVKPISYVLVLSTVYFIVTQLAGQNTWMDDLISGMALGALDAGEEGVIPPVIEWFAKNFAYTTLLLIPVYSLASFLSFKSKKLNYLEHFIMNAYSAGQKAIIYSIFALIKMLYSPEVLEVLPILLAYLYSGWVFWGLFHEGGRRSTILRIILTFFLYFIFANVVLIAALGISEVLG